MSFEVKDIDIFITTYNRANYIAQAIESLLNQSVNMGEITVLDNDSSDNTKEVVSSYFNRGVKYIKTQGILGNYKKAREIASNKYVMLFHDDDIVHHNYLELVLKALNSYQDVSLITTRYTEFFEDKLPRVSEKISSEHYMFKKQKDFAKHMYYLENIAYATAIYRRDDFLNIDLEYEKFSKFNDWPLMVKMAKYGNVVLFEDPSLYFVRRHQAQDTWTSINTPSIEQIMNWDKFFYEILAQKSFFPISRVDKIMFNFKSKYFANGKYENFLSQEDRNSCSFEDFFKKYLDSRIQFDIEMPNESSMKRIRKSYYSKLNSKCKRSQL